MAVGNFDDIADLGDKLLKKLATFDRGPYLFGATATWGWPDPATADPVTATMTWAAADPVTAQLRADGASLRVALETFLDRLKERGQRWGRQGDRTLDDVQGGTAPDVLVGSVYLRLWVSHRGKVIVSKDFRRACYAVLDMAGAHDKADERRTAADVLKHALSRFLKSRK